MPLGRCECLQSLGFLPGCAGPILRAGSPLKAWRGSPRMPREDRLGRMPSDYAEGTGGEGRASSPNTQWAPHLRAAGTQPSPSPRHLQGHQVSTPANKHAQPLRSGASVAVLPRALWGQGTGSDACRGPLEGAGDHGWQSDRHACAHVCMCGCVSAFWFSYSNSKFYQPFKGLSLSSHNWNPNSTSWSLVNWFLSPPSLPSFRLPLI